MTEKALFESPNLDCLSDDADDYRTVSEILYRLADYCDRKAFAMKLRIQGRTEEALLQERTNQELYDALPQWAKW